MKNLQDLIAVVLASLLVVSFGPPLGVCWAALQAGEPQADAEKAQLKIGGKLVLSLVLEDEQSRFIALVSSITN